MKIAATVTLTILLGACGHHDPKRPRAAQQTQALLAASRTGLPDLVLPSRTGRFRWAIYVDGSVPRFDYVLYRDAGRARGLFGNGPQYNAGRSSRDAILEALSLWLGLWEGAQALAPLSPSEVSAVEWHWLLGNPCPYLRSMQEREIRLDVTVHGGSAAAPDRAWLVASGLASDLLPLERGCPDMWGWVNLAVLGRGPVLIGNERFHEAFALGEVRAWQ